MIITIHQPEYLPWLGYFDRIARSDIFIILDNVQFQKRGFINRNKIKTPYGWRWLTVSVNPRMKNYPINKVEINNLTNWSKEHYKLISIYYAKAPYFKKYHKLFEEAYKKQWNYIVDLDIYLLNIILSELGIKKKIYRSSTLKVQGKATDLNINICKKMKADTYLSGPGGKRYMDMTKFKEAGIKVLFQKFDHPTYQQLYPEQGFIPQLSIIDLLFNYGKQSLDIITGGY